MHKLLVLIVLISGVFLSPHARAADFEITAEIDQASLQTPLYKEVGRFYVDVIVLNTSALSQTINVWGNPGWSFVTDRTEVSTSQEALSNFASKIIVDPGKIYKTKLEMSADATIARPITFSLGFLQDADRPIMNAHDPHLVWSNVVTLSQ